MGWSTGTTSPLCTRILESTPLACASTATWQRARACGEWGGAVRCVIGGNRILHARTIKIGPRHHLDVVVVVKDGVLRDGDLAQGLCAREPVPLLFQPLIHTSVLFIALIDHGCKEVILRLGFLTAGRTLPVMIAGMKTTRACSPSSVWMVEEATGRLLPKQRRTVPPKRMHPAGGTDGAAGPFKRTPLAPRLGPRHAVLHITVAIPVSNSAVHPLKIKPSD